MAKKLGIEAWWDGSRVKRGIEETKASIQSLETVMKGAFAGVTIAVAGAELKKLYIGAVENLTAFEKLNQSIKRFGGGESQFASVRKEVDRLSYSTGITDSKISAVFRSLVTTSGDLERSIKALPLALDVMTARSLDGAEA